MVALWPLLTPNTTPSLVIQPEEALECLKCEDKKHFLERCPLQELGVAEEKKGRNWEKNHKVLGVTHGEASLKQACSEAENLWFPYLRQWSPRNGGESEGLSLKARSPGLRSKETPHKI